MKTTYAFILAAITTALAVPAPEGAGSALAALDRRGPAYENAINAVKKRCDDCDDDDYDDGLCFSSIKLAEHVADLDFQDDYDDDDGDDYKLAKRCYDTSCDFYKGSEGYNYYVS